MEEYRKLEKVWLQRIRSFNVKITHVCSEFGAGVKTSKGTKKFYRY
jgi:hypothetical protein